MWLDSRGETARAVVRQKHEEITVHNVPLGGWDRWYRVGVEFPTSSGALGMATLTLPRERYDELRLGDSVAVHYPPFFPYIARAAERTTLQALGDATTPLFADPFFARFLLWLVAGIIGLWLASRIATLVIPVAGAAWIVAGFMFLFPAANPPAGGAMSGTARVQGVTLITKAPARRAARRSRAARAFGDVRRLTVPYQVVQLVLAVPGRPDSILAVDAVDSGSVAGLDFGATVSVRYDPRDPRQGRLASGRRTFLERNRYHFRVPMIGLAIVGMLGAWGARGRRTSRPRQDASVTPPSAAR
jgi:hypothetical protein